MATITAADVNYQAANESAKQQMLFQQYMSDTAHQREVQDLKAAGLNPVLSAGGSGASVTNGAEGYVGDANAKILDEQQAAAIVAQKELDHEFNIDMLNAETNAKKQIQELELANKQALMREEQQFKLQLEQEKNKSKSSANKSSYSGSSRSSGSSKVSGSLKTSGSTNSSKSSNSTPKNNTAWTGFDYIDNAINTYANRHPAVGLVLAAGKYTAENAKVGTKVNTPSGSSAKAAKRKADKIVAEKGLAVPYSSIGR